MIVMTRPNKPLVFIGLDGVSWPFLRYVLEKCTCHNIRGLITRMEKKVLISTIPPMTVIAWTSIFSGVNPGKHGVFGFLKFGKHFNNVRLVNSFDVKYPRLWEILNLRGYKQLVINVPLSTPFKPFKGVGIPDWLSVRPQFFVSSDDISNSTIHTIRENIKFLSRATGKFWWFLREDKKMALNNIVEELEFKVKIYSELINVEDWDSVIVVFSEPDWLQHLAFIEIIREESDFMKMLEKIFREIDTFMKNVYRVYGKEAVYVIVSDHGFQLYEKLVSPNKILLRGKLLRTNMLDLVIHSNKVFCHLSKSVLNRYISKLVRHAHRTVLNSLLTKQKINYRDSLAFMPEDISGMGIRINKKLIAEKQINHNHVRKLVCSILRRFSKKADAFSLIDYRERVYWGENLKLAPDIVVLPNMKKGFWITSDPFSREISFSAVSNHSMSGIFGITDFEGLLRLKDTITRISAYDVLQLILYSINASIPSYHDGRELKALVEI